MPTDRPFPPALVVCVSLGLCRGVAFRAHHAKGPYLLRATGIALAHTSERLRDLTVELRTSAFLVSMLLSLARERCEWCLCCSLTRIKIIAHLLDVANGVSEDFKDNAPSVDFHSLLRAIRVLH